MEKQKLTVNDVLNNTIKMLNGIQIPIVLIDTVGYPIQSAIQNIKICINNINIVPESEEVSEENNEQEVN